jgi:hypothetical protein
MALPLRRAACARRCLRSAGGAMPASFIRAEARRQSFDIDFTIFCAATMPAADIFDTPDTPPLHYFEPPRLTRRRCFRHAAFERGAAAAAQQRRSAIKQQNAQAARTGGCARKQFIDFRRYFAPSPVFFDYFFFFFAASRCHFHATLLILAHTFRRRCRRRQLRLFSLFHDARHFRRCFTLPLFSSPQPPPLLPLISRFMTPPAPMLMPPLHTPFFTPLSPRRRFRQFFAYCCRRCRRYAMLRWLDAFGFTLPLLRRFAKMPASCRFALRMPPITAFHDADITIFFTPPFSMSFSRYFSCCRRCWLASILPLSPATFSSLYFSCLRTLFFFFFSAAYAITTPLCYSAQRRACRRCACAAQNAALSADAEMLMS